MLICINSTMKLWSTSGLSLCGFRPFLELSQSFQRSVKPSHFCLCSFHIFFVISSHFFESFILVLLLYFLIYLIHFFLVFDHYFFFWSQEMIIVYSVLCVSYMTEKIVIVLWFPWSFVFKIFKIFHGFFKLPNSGNWTVLCIFTIQRTWMYENQTNRDSYK